MLKLPTLKQSDDDDDELQQAKKNYEEMENKFKKLLEEQKQKLEQVEQKQKCQSAADQGSPRKNTLRSHLKIEISLSVPEI